MALTLAEAAAYKPLGLERGLLYELMRESPWLAEIRAQEALRWKSLPWHKKLKIRAGYWLRTHRPHVHFYLGDHPREDDWY